MKHQSVRDRMHEGEGMARHAMKHHKGHHSHHGHHSGPHEHFGQSMREESSHHMYRNEVEMPEVAAMAHPGHGQGAHPDMGLMMDKAQADSIAYGQASYEGLMADEKRINSQFKDYHWD